MNLEFPYRGRSATPRGLRWLSISTQEAEAVTTKQTSIKPHLDKWRTMISSVEADARLSASDKEEIFSVLEGLVSVPRLRWSEVAAKERAYERP